MQAETAGAEKRVGLVHAAVNDSGIALYAASWFARRHGNDRLGAVLAAAGLEPLDEGPYRELSHRVDASIVRDVVVGRLPE